MIVYQINRDSSSFSDVSKYSYAFNNYGGYSTMMYNTCSFRFGKQSSWFFSMQDIGCKIFI